MELIDHITSLMICKDKSENMLISYDDEDEKSAISYVMKNITKNIVIINNLNMNDITFGKSTSLYEFKNGEIVDSKSGNISQKYIYCVRIDDSVKNDYANYDSKILIKNLKEYQICDFYKYECFSIPICYPRNFNHIPKQNIVIINLLNGIGDFFVCNSIYIEVIRKYKSKGKKVYIAYPYDLYRNKNQLFDLFLSDECERMYFSSFVFYRYLFDSDTTSINITTINAWVVDGYYGEIYHNFLAQKNTLLHGSEIDPYKFLKEIKNTIKSNIDKFEMEYIHSIISKNYVGFQFYTDHGTAYADSRCWNEKNVIEYLDLCSNNNIKNLILTPHPYTINNADEVKNLSLAGYIYLVSNLDYVIGIDSSAGHIASFFDKKTLTIWDRDLSLVSLKDKNTKISFRCMRNNISIVPQNSISEIRGEYVYNLVHKMLNTNECEYTSFKDIFDKNVLLKKSVYIV